MTQNPLKAIPLLSGATAEDWRRFQRAASVRTYRPGNILFYQGNPPTGMHFIIRGRVKLLKEDRAGRRQIVRIVTGPDLLGERSFFAEHPYACTGEVMDAAEIGFLSPRQFWELFGRNSDTLRLLAQRFAVKLGRAEDYMNCLAVCTILQRMAARLVKGATRQDGTWVPKGEFLLTETRTELAQALGTTPEAVSRSLAKLSKKGLISITGPRVRVLSQERLRLLACVHDSLF